jgi:phosphoribosylanthranilate isomerase
MIYVKICGITNVEDACHAVEAGADLLGFIFYPPSPRSVAAQQAALIVAAVRGAYGDRAPRFVGVFVDEPIESVDAILRAADLDLAQLHGSETPAQVRALSPRAFKAVSPRTMAQAAAATDAFRDATPDDKRLPQLLIDAYHPERRGGTGLQADRDLACWLAPRVRLLLAGGLTPENVAIAVEQIQPWGVDVSSGVELRPGVKDPARVRAFVQAARSAARALGAPDEPATRVAGSGLPPLKEKR